MRHAGARSMQQPNAKRGTCQADGESVKEGLRLELSCPACGAKGTVDCNKLDRGLRCHHCRDEFALLSGGRIVSLAALKQIPYTCPRCKRQGRLPAIFASRHARCADCQLPLELGPDRKLHSKPDANQLRRLHVQENLRDRRHRQQHKSEQGSLQSKRRLRRTLLIGILTATMVVTAVTLKWSVWDTSLQVRAHRFARHCLASEWDDAAAFFEEDAVQRIEFERWRMRHLSSILDRYRPDNDRVRIKLEVIEQGTHRSTLRVTFQSPMIGTRSHVQCWNRTEGRWCFNSLATLAREDRTSATPPPRARPGP